jgi:RecA/RadA recombinase
MGKPTPLRSGLQRGEKDEVFKARIAKSLIHLGVTEIPSAEHEVTPIKSIPKKKSAVVSAIPLDIDYESLEEGITSMMGYATFEPEQRFWLQTGSKHLNGVFGSEALGIPYGKIVELAGEEHGGKTTLTTIIAGMAQRDGAFVGRIDAEDSRDAAWEKRLGMDASKVLTFYPKLVVPKSKKEKEKEKPVRGKPAKKKQSLIPNDIPRLQSAEDLFAQAEIGMARAAKMGAQKQFWFVDSVANLQVDKVVLAGTGGQTMSTHLGRAVFLSDVLPKWAGLCANYNATLFLINQLRDKPNVMFGDPTTSPGGRSLRHNCSIRDRVRRLANGQLKKGKRIIGLVGKITNHKNKAGGGSVQGLECGFRVVWGVDASKLATFQFVSAAEAEDMVKL